MNLTKFIDMTNSKEKKVNKERYSDPTAEQAVGHVMKEQKKAEELRVNIVIRIIKLVLELADMEIIEGIKIKDKRTGKVWLQKFLKKFHLLDSN